MAKNVNLTDKLGLDGRPTITIGDLTLSVDNSARTVLQVAELTSAGLDATSFDKIATLIFGKEDKKALDKLELSFTDYSTVIDAAADLIMGAEGEVETLDTTS